ncbi:Hormone-sensitive lipase [Aphelenchoides besseyi]|nr:Hormone-sensitive lipase [Aphelenchoides besseyi]KAI6210191.1 Hormone-sensitive lipase [Aphelenchoides besseyi]
MVGDSAGGNLIVSVALRLAQLKAARMPDGLIPIYTPFLFQYLPSPSRVLRFTDPLLHMGIVIRCAAAYTNCCPNGTKSGITRNSLINQGGHKSLLEYVDEVKAKHLVDSADCNAILSFMNLSNMSVPSSPLNGQTLVATKNRSTDKATREGEPKSLNNPIDETNTIESEEQREENKNATVYVNRSPSYISLSTCNYEQTLIDYLQSHPLTKTMTNLAADDDVFESENGQNAAELNGGRRLFNCTTPEAEKVETSLSELLKLNLPRDCLISPMYAPDDLLREIPTCRFISCHLDPLLDDTITFAKKLRNAGGRVASLDLLDGLPHGFLNFVPMSADLRSTHQRSVRVAGFNERSVHEDYGSIPNRLQLLRSNTTILIKATNYVSEL